MILRKLYKCPRADAVMNIEVVHQDTEHAELFLDNITVAEILRVYLAEQGVDFVAWRREHPSKPVVLKITSEKGVAKSVDVAVSALKKNLDLLRAGLKK